MNNLIALLNMSFIKRVVQNIMMVNYYSIPNLLIYFSIHYIPVNIQPTPYIYLLTQSRRPISRDNHDVDDYGPDVAIYQIWQGSI